MILENRSHSISIEVHMYINFRVSIENRPVPSRKKQNQETRAVGAK